MENSKTTDHPLSVPVELEDVPMTGWAVLVFNRSSDGPSEDF